MTYNGATICANGHVVSKCKANFQNYCSKCGKETYSFCLACNSPIRGVVEATEAVFLGNRHYDKPYYCFECGAPYPWTQKVLDSAVELVSLDDDLDETSKELIKSAIPELLQVTPITPVAIAKYQKGMSRAGQIIKDSMRQLLVDVISESVKKILFP